MAAKVAFVWQLKLSSSYSATFGLMPGKNMNKKRHFAKQWMDGMSPGRNLEKGESSQANGGRLLF